MIINCSHKRNIKFISHFRLHNGSNTSIEGHLSCSPEHIDQPYVNLGTHPDTVKRLWDELTVLLPANSNWVVCGMPVLAHPSTGVIFGFATGLLTYALCLPPEAFAQAPESGAKRVLHYPAYPELDITASTLNLDDLGDGWVFGNWQAEEMRWCLSAYEFSGI